MKIVPGIILLTLVPLVLATNSAQEKRDASRIISVTPNASSFGADVTSAAGSIFSDITSKVHSIVTSVGDGLISQALAQPASVTTIVTSYTIVSSIGGSAITLAPSGSAGTLTSFAGSIYTEVPASTNTATNAASPGAVGYTFSAPMITGVAAVVSSMLMGLWMVM